MQIVYMLVNLNNNIVTQLVKIFLKPLNISKNNMINNGKKDLVSYMPRLCVEILNRPRIF